MSSKEAVRTCSDSIMCICLRIARARWRKGGTSNETKFVWEMYPVMECNRNKIIARLEREGWELKGGKGHDKYRHPQRPGIIIVPRNRELSIGVARDIAETAGWLERP